MLKDQNNLFFFQQKIMYWKFLNILKEKNIPHIFYMKITFELRKDSQIDEDVVMNKFFYFIEFLTGSKVHVKNYSKRTRKNKKFASKIFTFSGQVALRDEKLFNVLGFFDLYIYPQIKKNFIKINTLPNENGNVTFVLEDLSVLPGLVGEINYNIPMKIDIIFKDSKKIKTSFYFKEMGVF
jgi:ribosomal protein L5